MKWSGAKQHIALRLQAIERARRTAVEAQLNVARKEADETGERARDAQDQLSEAERNWVDHHARGRLDLELQRCLSRELLQKEGQAESRGEERDRAEADFERHRESWRNLEAGVRAGDRLLQQGRRFLSRRTEEARDQALSDQTTWKWFKR